nr:DUF4113 domain-containing protein [uncultured Microbulbifer sp.]
MDRINKEFGRGTLFLGAEGIQKKMEDAAGFYIACLYHSVGGFAESGDLI